MSPSPQQPGREAYRRILAEHHRHRELYASFGLFHPVRKLERRTRRRAWVGTFWPAAARAIACFWGFKQWLWKIFHPVKHTAILAELEEQDQWERDNPEAMSAIENQLADLEKRRAIEHAL